MAESSISPKTPEYSPPSLDKTSKYLNIITGKQEKTFHVQIRNNEFNHILTSLANGLRRTIITEIPTYSFDVESLSGFDNPNLQFIENKSKYHNDYLAHRISLVPINFEIFQKNLEIYKNYHSETTNSDIPLTIEEFNISNIKFKLSVENRSATINSHVYVKTKDMKIYYGDNELSNEKYKILNPDIILAKLAPLKRDTDLPENINFIATPSRGYGYMHTRFSPTSNIEYWFEEDINLIESKMEKMDLKQANRFKIEQSQRLFIGHEENQPQIFNIKYKSKGSINNYSIFGEAIKNLKTQILEYKTKLNTGENFELKEDTNSMNAIDVFTNIAGHTVGNILVEYSRYHPGIDYIAYKIPHPLKKEMVIRIKCTNEYIEQSSLDHKTRAINILNDTCNHLINIITSIEEEFSVLSDEYLPFQD